MGERKSYLGLGILIGLLFAVICFLIYYILGNKVDKSATDVDSHDTQVSESKYNYSLKSRKYLQRIDFSGDGYAPYTFIYVDIDGSVYMDMHTDNTKYSNILDKYDDYYLKSLGECNSEGPEPCPLTALKLNIDNVKFVQKSGIGNGGFSILIFILENGEVAYLSDQDILETGNANVVKIEGLKDIVAAVPDRNLPYVIDVNGNEYSLSDYID